MNNYIIAVIAMSLTTQVPRLIPAFLPKKGLQQGFLSRFLSSIPLAALGALIVPGIFRIGETPYIGIAGGLLSLFLAYRKVNLMLNIVVSTFFVTILFLL